jgi:hypothetical protein
VGVTSAASLTWPSTTHLAAHTTATSYDPYAGRRASSARLVLRALGANAEAGFAQLIYDLMAPLVTPFFGLFGTPQVASGPALELHTLVALLVLESELVANDDHDGVEQATAAIGCRGRACVTDRPNRGRETPRRD